MLRKQNRLVSKKDFDDVRLLGQKYSHSLFTLQALFIEDQQPPKFGFIVTNRISKKAVDRNQTRRIFREIIRQFLPQIKNGNKIVFWAKKIIVKPEALLLKQEIGKLLVQAKIIQNENPSS